MVQQISNGIKISVRTQFEGTFYKEEIIHFAFSYEVSISNERQSPVQLLSRVWYINDALNFKESIEGDGVVGEQPIIQPSESYSYSSGCTLKSPFGSMKGLYSMVDLLDQKKFKAKIPTFKLCTEFAQN